MCGIAGVVAASPIEGLSTILEGFSQRLWHRGPDDCGFLTWAGGEFRLARSACQTERAQIGVVHRRLAILDLSERGWQPMVDRTGRYAIVLNGEIYNYPELRAELEAEGVPFSSESDTEVLLNLLALRGMDALRQAVGMFAIAFIDRVTRRLWLARDPFGIKPLFYAAAAGRLAFGSEIRPLLDFGFASRIVEPRSLFDYLRHAVTDHTDLTMVAGVRQVMPAHILEVDIDSASITTARRYWAPSFGAALSEKPQDAAARLRHLFSDSVKLHLRSDVPVAATLSGGIDSSAIVGTVARLNGPAALTVFSYVADDPAIREERFLEIAADSAGVKPHKIRLNPEQLAEQLDALILTQEQPFTTTSMWAQNRVFHRVHGETFKVVIDGQGADEMFAGYPVFRAARLSEMIRRGQWMAALGFIRSIPESRGTLIVRAMGDVLPHRAREWARRIVGRPIVPAWLDAGWFARHGGTSVRLCLESGAPTELRRQLFDAMLATSLPMLLRYADRNAMAFSLENRVPFLTTAIAEFAASLPDNLLIGPDGTTKELLRSAMRGVVPDVILDRRDKIGFATPEARWFMSTPALRVRLKDVARRSLPGCFARDVGPALSAVAEGRTPYRPETWRCWNVLRWADLLKLEFPS